MLAMTCIVLLLARIGESSVVTPDNKIAITGRQLTLHCSADSKESRIRWQFRKAEDIVEHLIADGANVSSSFREHLINHTSDGQFSLINKNPQFGDAGTYKCIQAIGSDRPIIHTYTSVITVLASDPECSVSTNSSTFVVHKDNFLWCQVNYTGVMTPVVRWSRSDGTPVSVNVTTFHSAGYDRIKAIVTDKFSTADNGVNVTFKISFLKPSLNITGSNVINAKNTPDYEHSQLFTINVTYGVRNMTIAPESKQYKPGDRIECWADGNPNPTYEWTELGTDNITQGPTLTVDETYQQSQRFIYQCTASNVVDGQRTSTSKKVVVNVVFEKQSGSPVVTLLPTVLQTGLSVIGAIVVTSILGYCIHKLVHKNKDRKTQENALEPENGYEEIEDIATEVFTKDNPVETTIADMETIESNSTTELEDQNCYYNLSGERSPPVPAIYLALENSESLVENDSYEKEEMAEYTNVFPTPN